MKMITENTVEKSSKQRTIQSVEVGFRLIKSLVTEGSAMSLKDLSSSAGMSPSKANLYLNSFRNIGLVEQDQRGHYKLGPFGLRLGVSAISQLDVVEEAREELLDLRDQIGESVFISVWSGDGPCIVAKKEGLRDTPLVLKIGHRLPLLRSATGRVFLTYLPNSVIEPLLANAKQELMASGGSSKVVDEVRRYAMARSSSQINTGLSALSVPIFNHDGTIAGALTVLGPRGLLDISYTGAPARYLSDAAKRISANLGYGLESETH